MVRLRAERLRRGLAQRDLAQLARVAQPHLCQIETGVQLPYPPERQRLAAALGLDPDGLLDEVELVMTVREIRRRRVPPTSGDRARR